MSAALRYAVCNELFGGLSFAETCQHVARLGYEGIEIAPYTLSGDPAGLPAGDRSAIRKTISDAGLCFVGLHWLLAAPPGLQLTTPDLNLRQRSWQYLHQLVDLCADISVCREEFHAVMVLGSPKQRSVPPDMPMREALDIFTHELAHAAPHAESRGIRILVEALSPDQTNLITTLAEANNIVRQIGSPAVQTMFDSHNAVAERDSHAELIRRYGSIIQHVHLNELNGSAPGSGDYDFASVLAALAHIKYDGWVSMEVFGTFPDPVRVAADALAHLRSVEPEQALSQSL